MNFNLKEEQLSFQN